ncbi:hypothetical protein F4859DRAFT_516917 [Xylaria cf. heliscus]|nr:hypothetical protein F4859DRAFT_516917 [Xylaria cf. heliscus]
MAQTMKNTVHVGPSLLSKQPFISKWSSRYRGATVQDLEPPAALSLNPNDPISLALVSAFEREYTHLTIVDSQTRGLVGYIAIPVLQAQLESGAVQPEDPLSRAMVRFQRKGRRYTVITLETPLEDLEAFFEGVEDGDAQDQGQGQGQGQKQDFAVVTDEDRRFVLGVATREDLEEFVKRRPA